MSQIININVGKAGVRIGEKFLKQLGKQHFSDQEEPRGRPEVFFNQTLDKGYESRSIFVDLNPSSIEKINLKTEGYSILQKNLFKGTGLFSDLFAVAKYHEGAELTCQAFEQVRKQVEKCDRLSGFVICNSMAGGTGSGLTSQMLSKLRQNYCASMVEQHFVLPQTDNLTSPLHIYNAVLALNYSIEQTDICIMAENQALGRRMMLEQNLRPSMDQINQIHAEHITNVTAPYRFSGNINTNQRKTCTNLTPFPRIKFMISSCSTTKERSGYLEDLFNPLNFSQTQFFSKQTQYFDIYTLQVSCRDNFAYESEIDTKVRLWLNEAKLRLADWIPNNIHSAIIEQITPVPKASMLINSRHVTTVFERWSDIFTAQFRRKAFIYHYTAEGMDEMEFTQAESNLNDLISEHIPCYGFDDQELEDYPQEDNA